MYQSQRLTMKSLFEDDSDIIREQMTKFRSKTGLGVKRLYTDSTIEPKSAKPVQLDCLESK